MDRATAFYRLSRSTERDRCFIIVITDDEDQVGPFALQARETVSHELRDVDFRDGLSYIDLCFGWPIRYDVPKLLSEIADMKGGRLDAFVCRGTVVDLQGVKQIRQRLGRFLLEPEGRPLIPIDEGFLSLLRQLRLDEVPDVQKADL